MCILVNTDHLPCILPVDILLWLIVVFTGTKYGRTESRIPSDKTSLNFLLISPFSCSLLSLRFFSKKFESIKETICRYVFESSKFYRILKLKHFPENTRKRIARIWELKKEKVVYKWSIMSNVQNNISLRIIYGVSDKLLSFANL